MKPRSNTKEQSAPPKKEIILISPRGFCAGVTRAVQTVEKALEIFSPPLYVHHQIVHNRRVVEDFEKKGVIFIDSLGEMPNDTALILSAHGVTPQLRAQAKEKNLTIIDATCPLVAKVHLEAIRFAKEGRHIFFIGHKNHAETIGTLGEAPENITVVENEQQIRQLKPTIKKTAYLTQTTLSLFETKKMIQLLKEKFPGIEGPAAADICYATTNRQSALSQSLPQADAFIIIGSPNSSNSNRLRELVEPSGKPAYLIDSPDSIQPSWLQSIQRLGVTAGASSPEDLIAEVIDTLQNRHAFHTLRHLAHQEETMEFKLPYELQKELQKEHRKPSKNN